MLSLAVLQPWLTFFTSLDQEHSADTAPSAWLTDMLAEPWLNVDVGRGKKERVWGLEGVENFERNKRKKE